MRVRLYGALGGAVDVEGQCVIRAGGGAAEGDREVGPGVQRDYDGGRQGDVGALRGLQEDDGVVGRGFQADGENGGAGEGGGCAVAAVGAEEELAVAGGRRGVRADPGGHGESCGGCGRGQGGGSGDDGVGDVGRRGAAGRIYADEAAALAAVGVVLDGGRGGGGGAGRGARAADGRRADDVAPGEVKEVSGERQPGDEAVGAELAGAQDAGELGVALDVKIRDRCGGADANVAAGDVGGRRVDVRGGERGRRADADVSGGADDERVVLRAAADP